MILLDVPSSVERELATRAVRSTAISPEQRFHKDRSGYKRDYQNALFNEKLSKDVAARASDAGRDITDKEQQKGMVLPGWLIMARLRKLNPSLWFEVAKADETKVGIYYLDPLADGGKRFICGMLRGDNPEFTCVDSGTAMIATPGWRRVLMKLIRKGFISEPKTFAMFGPPTKDSAAWQTLTQ